MTTEEYLTKRIVELERENERLNERLKDLIGTREIHFVFEDRAMKNEEYRVFFDNENGQIKIQKVELLWTIN